MATKAIVLVALGALLHPAIAFADAVKLLPSDSQERIARDAKTMLIFYLESDQHHLVAISPEGRIVWTSEIPGIQSWHISSFKLSNGELIIGDGNVKMAVIDSKTGAWLGITRF
jgi:hypothetical protein